MLPQGSKESTCFQGLSKCLFQGLLFQFFKSVQNISFALGYGTKKILSHFMSEAVLPMFSRSFVVWGLMRACTLSCFRRLQLFVTPWTIARQAPLFMGFSRQEHWARLPFPSPGRLPGPGMELASLTPPALAGGFFTTSTTWQALQVFTRPLIHFEFSSEYQKGQK